MITVNRKFKDGGEEIIRIATNRFAILNHLINIAIASKKPVTYIFEEPGLAVIESLFLISHLIKEDNENIESQYCEFRTSEIPPRYKINNSYKIRNISENVDVSYFEKMSIFFNEQALQDNFLVLSVQLFPESFFEHLNKRDTLILNFYFLDIDGYCFGNYYVYDNPTESFPPSLAPVFKVHFDTWYDTWSFAGDYPDLFYRINRSLYNQISNSYNTSLKAIE
jgi:hypothetical protein